MADGDAVEQRRSQRCSYRLPVEVAGASRRFSAETENVSRHGLFLMTEEQLPERVLLQLALQLPDGTRLSATGFVTRRTPAGAAVPGLGVQFFTLAAAAKAAWDGFVAGLLGGTRSRPQIPAGSGEHATFLLRLRDRARLLDFQERNLKRGGLYMATPVLKPEGTPLGLVVVHPETEAEFLVPGRVARVCLDAPKGMEVRFDVPAPAELERFAAFVRTGQAPVRTPPPEVEDAAQSLEESALTFDIVVDEQELEKSAEFKWDDVSDYRSVLDLEITQTADLTAGVESLGESLEFPAPRRLGVGDRPTVEQPAPPELLARALPSGQHPAPLAVAGGPGAPAARRVTGDLPRMRDEDPAESGSNRRQKWTWPTPPQGVTPPRMPPPRSPSGRTPPPQVLDLGPEHSARPDPRPAPTPPPTAEFEVPILDPLTEAEALSAPELADDDTLYVPQFERLLSSPPTGPLAPVPPTPVPELAPSRPSTDDAPTREYPAATPTTSAPFEERSPQEAAESIERAMDEALGAAPAVDEALAEEPPGEAMDLGASAAPEVAADPEAMLSSIPPAPDSEQVSVACEACGAGLGMVEVGPLPGPLGHLAEYKAYWNADLRRLVAVPRLKARDARDEARATLLDADAPVPLALLFEVADLHKPPADPSTGGRVRANGLVKALWQALDAEPADRAAFEVPGACPECDARAVKAHRRA